MSNQLLDIVPDGTLNAYFKSDIVGVQDILIGQIALNYDELSIDKHEVVIKQVYDEHYEVVHEDEKAFHTGLNIYALGNVHVDWIPIEQNVEELGTRIKNKVDSVMFSQQSLPLLSGYISLLAYSLQTLNEILVNPYFGLNMYQQKASIILVSSYKKNLTRTLKEYNTDVEQLFGSEGVDELSRLSLIEFDNQFSINPDNSWVKRILYPVKTKQFYALEHIMLSNGVIDSQYVWKSEIKELKYLLLLIKNSNWLKHEYVDSYPKKNKLFELSGLLGARYKLGQDSIISLRKPSYAKLEDAHNSRIAELFGELE